MSAVVDVHAHFLAPDLPPPADRAGPRLVVDTDGGGRILRGDALFRAVAASLWDVRVRLAEMDAAGVSHQVLSPVPVTMEHAAAGGAYARHQNDGILAACAGSGGRLLGLGCLPLHDARAAVAELDRIRSAGLVGVEIGTRVGDRDLDDPSLAPVWGALAATGSAVFVHPVDEGRGVVRRPGPPFDLGLGMLTDTALAASALVFGGVLQRHPGLRVALAHGCGAFPWAYPRLRVAAARAAVPGDARRWDELTRELYADTLVFDDEHLRLLVHRFGPERLLLGSDAPFFPDQMARSVADVGRARGSGALPSGVDLARLADNAAEYLGLPGWP
jgi:aminocarboxymuconate-semialdehyde decarboxylase